MTGIFSGDPAPLPAADVERDRQLGYLNSGLAALECAATNARGALASDAPLNAIAYCLIGLTGAAQGAYQALMDEWTTS